MAAEAEVDSPARMMVASDMTAADSSAWAGSSSVSLASSLPVQAGWLPGCGLSVSLAYQLDDLVVAGEFMNRSTLTWRCRCAVWRGPSAPCVTTTSHSS